MSSFPVLFVTGTHYDLGYQVGCTFKDKIQTHVKRYAALKYYQEYYETDEGRRFCKGYMKRCAARFPHYVKELQGRADGAGVSMEKLYLCNLERELDFMVARQEGQDIYKFKYEKGCTDILLNNGQTMAWGHNEDFYPDMETFLIHADLEPFSTDDGRKFEAEKFVSQSYVHSIPGQSYGFNKHGLVYSVDYLYPADVNNAGTAENFLTRSMLTARNIEELTKILADEEVGCSSGVCVHAAMLGSNEINTIEIAPNKTSKGSLIQMSTTWNGAKSAQFLANFNKYNLIDVDENEEGIASSRGRQERMSQINQAETVKQILEILGDETGNPYRIYRKDHFPRDTSITINTVLFDLKKQRFSLWHLANPKRNKPVLTLPLTL